MMAAINVESRKKNNKINEQSCSSWQTPPDDIMEYILQRLSLWDRIKLRKVCQSWRLVSKRRDIRSSPTESPWLFCSPSESLDLSSDNRLSFFSLSDTKVHRLTLPRALRGAWVCGSSKGWLVMVKGAYSKMFLLNPISGAHQELPSLKTIFPRFGVLKELKGELDGTHDDLATLCNQVVLSTSDIASNDCIVASIFRDRILALCRPGDKRWRKVFEFQESYSSKLSDILFSCGVLYALADPVQGDDLPVVAARTKILGEHKLEVKLVYDRDLPNSRLHAPWGFQSYLLESTSKDDVLLIHQIRESSGYGKVILIVVYKLDSETESFLELQNLGDQLIFLAEFGSSSLASAVLEGNCIYFATDMHAFYTEQADLSPGIFYLSSGRIERQIPYVDSSVLLQLACTVTGDHRTRRTCWFTPSL